MATANAKKNLQNFEFSPELSLLAHTKYKGPNVRNPSLSLGLTNNQCADQPAHLRRLISAFVIRVLESILSELGEISIF